MALTTFNLTIGTTTAPTQLSTGNTAMRALYLNSIGTLNCYIGASSTVTSTNGFAIRPADPPLQLNGAQASDVIWAVSTAAAGAILAGYRR